MGAVWVNVVVAIRTLTTSRPRFFSTCREGCFEVSILRRTCRGMMLSEFFKCPRTRRIDWWLIGLLLVSLLSFLGAAILGIIPVL